MAFSHQKIDHYRTDVKNGIMAQKPTIQHMAKIELWRVAIAAASGSLIYGSQSARLQISLNGDVVFDKEYENDGAIYRGMLQSGNFYPENVSISSEQKIGATL